MSTTIAIAGQKGGSGKTTIATNVAAELMERGGSVLLVDADPQGSAITWAAVATEAGHLTPTAVAMGATMHRADQLPKLGASYDWIVIDCPPRVAAVQRSALMAADLVVLPCGPSTLDAWAMAESVELVEAAQQINTALQAVVVINRQNARTSIGASAREALAELGLPVLQTEIGMRVAFAEAPSHGQGVVHYAARSSAADEVRAVVSELLELIQPKRRKARKGKG